MAYIPENVLRITQHGRVTAAEFLHQHCEWQQNACVDERGEVQPCTICLEPMHGYETINYSRSNIQTNRTNLVRSTLRSNSKCNHTFHTGCMTDYTIHAKGNTCPVCRCHWFDSAAEEEQAWEIHAALEALNTMDYTTRTKAQKRLKITIHAVVFTDMPSVVAHWLSKQPRFAETNKHRVCGRVARSVEGIELVNAIVAAFREFDGKRMRLRKLDEKILGEAIRVAMGKSGKADVRDEQIMFLREVVETVLGCYAYSQGLMGVQPSMWRRVLGWMHLR